MRVSSNPGAYSLVGFSFTSSLASLDSMYPLEMNHVNEGVASSMGRLPKDPCVQQSMNELNKDMVGFNETK